MYTKLVLFVVMVTLFSARYDLKAFSIVTQGRPEAEIILETDANASQRLAAEDLKEYIRAMSGVELTIVAAPSGRFANRIFVGESRHTRELGFSLKGVEEGGYKLFVEGNNAIVAGRDLLRKPLYDPRKLESLASWHKKAGVPFSIPSVLRGRVSGLGIRRTDDTGTWYAASEFLEQLGVRWFGPGELGTVIPDTDSLRLEPQNLVRVPHSACRDIYVYTAGSEVQRWLNRLRCGVSRLRYFNHTTGDIINKDMSFQFPQILARNRQGEFTAGHRKRRVPKLTDPEFRRLSALYLRTIFDELPELESHSLGMPDGLGEIDYEDSQRFVIGESFQNRFNNYVWDYWSWAADEIIKTHPDRLLDCAGYPPYFGPPDDTSLVRDNVAITLCYWTSWLNDPVRRLHVLETRAAWQKLLKPFRLKMWDYFLFFYSGKEARIPPFYTAVLQEDMQALKESCIGKFIEVKGDGGQLVCPGLMHFLIYWQSRLLWNPDEDRLAVLDDYLTNYFGPAAAPMKDFYEFAEESFCNPMPLHKHTVETLKEHNARYFEYIAAARAAVDEGSVYDRRIAQIEDEITPLRRMHKTLERKGPTVGLLPVPKGVDADKLEADPAKYDNLWTATLLNISTGNPIREDKTRIILRYDRNYLYLLAACHRKDMEGLKADCTADDDVAIFNDEVVEIYLCTPEHSFFKIVVNANGAVYDESTDPEIVQRNNSLPVLWSPGIKSHVRRLEDQWIVELAIPTVDFGSLGPTKEYTWGLQVGRTVITKEGQKHQAFGPTGGRYDVREYWGNVWAR